MKKLIRLLGVIFFAIIIIVVLVYVKSNTPYSDAINKNWSIKLPLTYKEIYSIDSGPSFRGDGSRYHVFLYTNANDVIQSLNWSSSGNETIELQIKEIINDLEVSKEQEPDFQNEYKYYTKTNKDFSKIYLIFVSDTKKLYIIERLI